MKVLKVVSASLLLASVLSTGAAFAESPKWSQEHVRESAPAPAPTRFVNPRNDHGRISSTASANAELIYVHSIAETFSADGEARQLVVATLQCASQTNRADFSALLRKFDDAAVKTAFATGFAPLEAASARATNEKVGSIAYVRQNTFVRGFVHNVVVETATQSSDIIACVSR